MVDLVIRGGTVYDGTGGPPVRADVAVDGDRIVEIGEVTTRGRREIDAEGHIVTPGFVDIHTHFDGQATWDPLLAPSCWHGITTVAMGNCGVGFAPARPADRGFLISVLEGVEDIPGTALAEGLPWNWETFPDYLDAIGEMHYSLDVGVHVPHMALRMYVMGARGADPDEHPGPAEVRAMADLVGEAIEAGAIGFATSRTANHRTSTGTQLGTLRADEPELMAIARALGAAGSGVIQVNRDVNQTVDEGFAGEELDLIEGLARASGRPVSVLVIQPMAGQDRWRQIMSRVDELVAQGLDVRGQLATRPIGLLVGLETSNNPFSACASFLRIAHLPTKERAAAMRVAQTRAAILEEFARIVANPTDPAGFRSHRLSSSMDVLFDLGDPVSYDLVAEDSFQARAARTGRDAVALLYDAMLESDGRKLLYWAGGANFLARNFDDLAEMVVQPNALFGLSDAGAHVRVISDASMTTSCMTLWGRDRPPEQRVPIEQLVHGLTQRNARYMGWTDRGTVAVGQLADLNVIDLGRLGCRAPTISFDLPASGARLLQRSVGYRATVKSGTVTFEHGEHTGEFPGRLVRGSALSV